MRYLLSLTSVSWVFVVVASVPQEHGALSLQAPHHPGSMFQPAETCLACHNSLSTTSGEDISIGSDWRGSMMANSSRDPYWLASVRRETTDHPEAASDIEDTCATCHMPMARTQAKAGGRKGAVFTHLPATARTAAEDRLAQDGVSCTMCHQITDRQFGTPESFTGGFIVDDTPSRTARPIFGPFRVDDGRSMIMQSAAGFRPVEASHIRQSELCATCHTVYTRALGRGGEIVGRLPEQVPYLEWRHSEFAGQRSCQSCHMPAVTEATPITSVLGEPRAGIARHIFHGGNFFVLGMLNRYRGELGVKALPLELDASVLRTVRHLQSDTATVSIERARFSGGRLEIDVAVQNLAGHKLPTGYPSRRVWVHLTVRDRAGRIVFESGRLSASGLIEENDHDSDPARYEPHYAEIRRSDEVLIYESTMSDADGRVTTGLLTGTRFIKDNRLLPRGFDKTTAGRDIAVVGAAAHDTDFAAGGDRVRYSVELLSDQGPFDIDVELRFQPISFRWAQNLEQYDTTETRRFVRYYDSMASSSTTVLARSRVVIR